MRCAKLKPRAPLEIDAGGTARIPLHARDGSIRAYALVDADDADWVNQWRWCLNHNGYPHRNGGLLLHRMLLDLSIGDSRVGDHINRDRLDCRRSNLRIVTATINRRNISTNRSSTSNFRGVSWDSKGKIWIAQIMANGRNIYLGRFTSEVQAADVAREARLRLMPGATD